MGAPDAPIGLGVKKPTGLASGRTVLTIADARSHPITVAVPTEASATGPSDAAVGTRAFPRASTPPTTSIGVRDATKAVPTKATSLAVVRTAAAAGVATAEEPTAPQTVQPTVASITGLDCPQ